MPHLTIVRNDVSSRIPVAPAVLDYLAATRRLRNAASQKTFTWQLHVFADWCDQVAGISLESIDAATVNHFLDYYEAKGRPRKAGATQVSRVTLVGMVTIVKAFLAWCSRDRQVWGDFVDRGTVAEIHKPKTPQVIIEVFTGAQIRQLLEACEGEENDRMRDRAKALIHVLIGTGVRAAECCALTLADAHTLESPPYIQVQCGKGDTSRRIPLGPITLRKLTHWITLYRDRAPATAPLFTTRDGEAAMTPATLQQLFQRLGERAHITGVRCSPHTCRHFFACECMRHKMSIYALSKLLGHSSVVMSERYLRALGADFQELADQTRGQLR